MNKNIDDIRFNLTHEMSSELIKFNNLKTEYFKLLNEYNDTNDKTILDKLKQLKQEMEKHKKIFIKEFKKNNREEILEYLSIKDQKWSFFVLKKEINKKENIIYIGNIF